MDEVVTTWKGGPLPTPCWLKPVFSKANTGATCAQVGGDLESSCHVSEDSSPFTYLK